MGVWGEHLRRQFSGALTTRTYFCASKCGNKGTGTNDCKAAANTLFGADATNCGNICTTSQCSAGVDRCISYCCSQDGGCVDTAHQKMTDNGFN